MRFREKTALEFEAVQWDGSNWHEIYAFCGMDNKVVSVSDGRIRLDTPQGSYHAPPDWWVLKYANGSFAAMPNEMIEDLYVPISDD